MYVGTFVCAVLYCCGGSLSLRRRVRGSIPSQLKVPQRARGERGAEEDLFACGGCVSAAGRCNLRSWRQLASLAGLDLGDDGGYFVAFLHMTPVC